MWPMSHCSVDNYGVVRILSSERQRSGNCSNLHIHKFAQVGDMWKNQGNENLIEVGQ